MTPDDARAIVARYYSIKPGDVDPAFVAFVVWLWRYFLSIENTTAE